MYLIINEFEDAFQSPTLTPEFLSECGTGYIDAYRVSPAGTFQRYDGENWKEVAPLPAPHPVF